jgi:hypothetical protein
MAAASMRDFQAMSISVVAPQPLLTLLLLQITTYFGGMVWGAVQYFVRLVLVSGQWVTMHSAALINRQANERSV